MKSALLRILILLLVSGLAISLIACKTQPQNPPAGSSESQSQEESQTEAPPEKDPDPVANYEGYVFTIYGREEDTSRSMMFPYEIGDNINEKGSFEAINSKIYARNDYIEKTYNVVIQGNYVTNNLGKMAAEVEASVKGGLVVYDLVLSSPYRMAVLLNKGLLQNWNDSKTVDFSKSYWNKNLIDNTTIGTYSYVASSDMLLSAIDLSTCIIFNKSLTERYSIENLYKLVEEGKWTIDRLYSLTKDIYSSQTDNDRRDEGDFYGFTTDLAAALRPYIYSSGMKLIDSTGEVPQVAINAGSAKFGTLIDKLNILLGSEGTFGCPQKNDQFKLPYENFKNGNSVMMAGTFSAVYSRFKDIKDLGILPYPLLEETSEPVYRSTINGEFSSMIIPSNNPDLDRTGVIASRGWTQGVKKNAEYVLMHTLAHLLIKEMSLQSGYSSSSIKERIYFGENMCGILLYTGSSDKEGSLGGLVELGNYDRLLPLLKGALENAMNCTNDPECMETLPTAEKSNGAACHSCSMISETACENGNRLLDRALVVPIGGREEQSYFRDLVRDLCNLEV